jgi:hypothetical protein
MVKNYPAAVKTDSEKKNLPACVLSQQIYRIVRAVKYALLI